MSTMTINVYNQATHGQIGAPSFLDTVVTGSSNPNLPDGTYDTYCLNAVVDIYLSETGNVQPINTYRADAVSGQSAAARYVSASTPSTITDTQISQINWILAQNFTSDAAKYGNQYTYGEVQEAIWAVLGQSSTGLQYLTDPSLTNGSGSNKDVLSTADIDSLVSKSLAAVTSGITELPYNTYFTMLVDPDGVVQPLILQLQSAKVGDYVWEDTNANGIRDIGELGINNVVVELYDNAGTLISSTTTGDDYSTAAVETGYYQFAGLKAGDYKVKFVTPANMLLSVQDATIDTADSDANPLTGFTSAFHLNAGETNQTIDAGLYKTAEIGNHVWFDDNRDGIQDANEIGAAGVTVTLLDANNQAVGNSITTDANGDYLFTGLASGNYSVQFTKPTGYNFTTQNASGSTVDNNSDPLALTGKTAVTFLAPGESDQSWDAGLVLKNADIIAKSKIGDKIWEDINANGIQDAGELGIEGVTVQLKDSAGLVVGTQTTGANGDYLFTVDAGTYSVAIVAPTGYVVSTPNQGLDNSVDSDFATNGASTTSYTLAAGETNLNVDGGLYKLAELGDRVWIDANKNGIQDANEAGVSGVKVTLLDATGNIVGSPLTTDANGNYLFTDLKPGTYNVQFDKTTLPAGYVFTTQDAGSDDSVDSDANVSTGATTQTVLTSGESDQTWSAGIVSSSSNCNGTSTIGDFVWNDSNKNGIQDAGEAGIANVSVKLLQATTSLFGTYYNVVSTTTDSNGKYLFGGLAAGSYKVQVITPTNYSISTRNQGTNDSIDSDIDSSGMTSSISITSGQQNFSVDAGLFQNVCVSKATIGNFVWEDINNNGIQDSGENGINCVSVKLLDAAGNVKQTTTTDSSGKYSFSVNPGDYKVKVIAPTNYSISKQNQGTNDSVDSDIDASGVTSLITVTSGQQNFTIDAGLLKSASLKATIGDVVWEDTNYNGIQDACENGISGVSVKLLDAAGNIKQTTTTDSSGKYSFSVDPGDYKVQVVAPTNYFITKQNQGANDSADSDISSSGVTSLITVTSGQQNLTVDAGLYKKAHVGDRVWEDWNHNNLQDTGEVVYDDRNNNGVKDAGEGSGGIPNITVKLLDVNGTVLQTTTTDESGVYGFDVNPGTYSLQFDKTNVIFLKSHWDNNLGDQYGYNMSNWKWAVKDTGTNDAVDSDVTGDATATTNVTVTSPFTLTSGQNDLTKDAGITPIVIDLNGDGIQTVSRSDSAGTFDLFGNGQAINSGWLSNNDGFLVVDNNNNGNIDDISELFGGLAKGDGFAKLASYDSNLDGAVNASDIDFANLKIWQDANGNHKTDEGELFTLADKGISSLAVNYTEIPFLDAQGNLHLERSNALLVDGNSVDMTDVYFNVSSTDVMTANVEVPRLAALMGAAELNADLFWIG